MTGNPHRSLRRGQGYVTLTGATSAQARWFDGKRWRAKTFHGLTIEEANDRAEAHIRVETKHVLDPDTQDATVSEIVELWLKRGRTRWTANTYSQYEMHYRTHLAPVLGDLRARDVTTARIQHWVDGLVAKGLSAGSVRLIYVIAHGPFKEATRLGMIRTNPAQGIALPTIRKKPKPTWTVADVQRVFAVLEEDAFWSAVYRFALTTGVRPGELIALRWGDVDFEQGHATISRTLTRNEKRQYVIGDDTKTHEPRTVAVPPHTIAALKRWRTHQIELRLKSANWLDEDLIFTATYGYHLEPKTWGQYQKRLCARADVPVMNLHGTRHTLATLMMAAREHPAVVQNILGHRSIKTTLDQYSHPSISLQERAMSALDEQISGPSRAKKG